MKNNTFFKAMVILLLSVFSFKAKSQVLEADSLALVALFNSTDGINWIDNTGWLVDPVENWTGIVVDQGRVNSINLTSNDLNGTIPSELGNLTSLEFLELSSNSLSGEIPPELAGLVSVIAINLDSNDLTGSIPASFGVLRTLQILQLRSNQLSGDLPLELGDALALTELHLFSNQLTGSIPVEFGNLSALVTLDLSNNQLSGGIPAQLGNLINLNRLDLSNNLLSQNIPAELTGASSLRSLQLSRNQLEGPIPSGFGGMLNLTLIDFSSNNLTGQIPGEFGSILTLQVLFLEGNQLTGNIPIELGSLSALTGLRLGNNQLDGNIPVELGNLTALVFLDLSNNQLTGSIPMSFESLVALNTINLAINQLSGSIPDALGNILSLEILMLFDNQLTGAVPNSLTSSPVLRELNLANNLLEDLPDFSGSPTVLSGGYDVFNVATNIFDFVDLEPNNGLFTIIPTQQNFGLSTDNLVMIGDALTLGGSFVQGSPNDTYQWQLNGLDIPGATNLTYNLPSISFSDIGSYQLLISNSIVTDVVLRSTFQNVITNQTVLPTDSMALVELYNSTDGPNWTNNTNWTVGPFETWFGVELQNGRVYRIDLGGNNLIGTLPAALGDLTELDFLELSTNQLTGDLPSSLGGLTNLTFLSIFNNQLTGSIPPEFGELTSLSTLQLGNNMLSGTIPPELGNMTNLVELLMPVNALTGNIPPELGNLTALSSLQFSQNQLTGIIPEELGMLANLTFLDLADNSLEGVIPLEIGGLSLLSSITLNNNSLTGTIPIAFGNLSNLNSINLAGNQLNGDIPIEFGNLSNLTFLELSNNQLTGSIPVELGQLSNLTFLSAFNNQLEGTLPVELGNLSNLELIQFGLNNLTGSIPTEYGNLLSLGSLLLSSNQLTGAVPNSLISLTNLTDIELFDNNLDELPDFSSLPAVVGGTLNLFRVDNNLFDFGDLEPNAGIFTDNIAPFQQNFGEAINVNAEIGGTVTLGSGFIEGSVNDTYQWRLNGVEIAGANSLTLTLPNVTEADLGNYDLVVNNSIITDVTLLSNFQTLRRDITVSSNDSLALVALYNATGGPNWTNNNGWLVEGERVIDWFGVTVDETGVIGLDLNNNNLIGSIPSIIGDLTNLRNLNLGFNELSGVIPVELGNAVELTRLFLNNNLLEGNIPVEIGSLISLDRLALSRNQLTGIIPDEIGQLTSLISLRLDQNVLTGSIPTTLGALLNLGEFNLSENQLTGSIPTEFGSLTSLNNLSLSNNELTGTIPSELSNVVSLRSLNLSNNQLSGAIPNELGTLVNLETLALGDNQLTGELPTELTNLTALSFFSIGNNQLGGSIPVDFTTLGSLSIFDVTRNNFDELPDFSASPAVSSSTLTSFRVEGNRFSFRDLEPNADLFLNIPGQQNFGVTNTFGADIGDRVTIGENLTETTVNNVYQWQLNGIDLAGETNEILVIPSFSIADAGEYQLIVNNSIITQVTLRSNFQTLRFDNVRLRNDSLALVDLYNSTDGPNWSNNTNWLTGPINSWFGVVLTDGRVTQLNLGDNGTGAGTGNGLIGTIPGSIGDLNAVTRLDLTNNQLMGSIPASISNMNSLNLLFLSGNDLSGEIPVELGTLFNLTQLTLFQNNLIGEIPTSFGNLSNLTILFLGNNQLNGTIPPELGNLTLMERFDLRDNQLEGSIPASFGGLTLMTEFGVARNNLSGEIPSGFNNLVNLTTMDLSGNLLEGSVPDLSALSQLLFLGLNDNELTGFNALPDNSGDLFAQNNRLDFVSLEQLVTLPFNVILMPQKSLLMMESPLENEGDNVLLDRTIGGSINDYQWFRNGAELTGEINATLSLDAVSFDDEGDYFVTVENANVPGVTLTTNSIVLRVSSLERDSVALRQVFLATQGTGGWTNRPSWVDQPLANWEGVGINGNRVTSLDISNSTVTGEIPVDILDVVNLTTVNLSGNQIDGIPNFSELVNLTDLDVSNNFVQFGDLEENVTINTFNFTGQQLRDVIQTDSVEMGMNFTVMVDVTGENNVYQWSLNGTEVTGAIESSYLIEAIDRSNMGAYTCEVNNSTPELAGLTFTSAIDSVLAVADIAGFVRIAGTSDQFIEEGNIQLLQVSATAYDTIRVNSLVGGGAYSFDRVVLADYVVVVDPTDRETFLPTYHEQAIQWDLATILELNEDTTNIDVNVEGDPGEFDPDEGNGLIGGEIVTDFADENGRLSARRRVRRVGCALRRRRGQGRTDEDEFELVGYTTTDEEGRFTFENLPVGTYRLFIEYPGIPINEDAFTEFEVGADMDENEFTVAATVFDDGIDIQLVEETGVPFDYLEELNIYPNPAEDALFLRINARQSYAIVLELLDLSGSIVLTQEINSLNFGNGTKKIDISGINSGIYLIKVKAPEFSNQLLMTGKLIVR